MCIVGLLSAMLHWAYVFLVFFNPPQTHVCVHIHTCTSLYIFTLCVCVCVCPYMLSHIKGFGAFTRYSSSSVNVTDGNNVCSNIEKNVDQFYRKTSSIDSSRKGAAHGKERVVQGRRKILFFSLHIFVLFDFVSECIE